MTLFNRADKTKKCIDSILSESIKGDFLFNFYITNDGSTDNTGTLLDEYIRNNRSHSFHIFSGSGNLFWNKGMYLAYEEALKNNCDYFLWVNNDVEFSKGFLNELIRDAERVSKETSIYLICGSVSYRDRNELSYGGAVNLSKVNPYKRKLLQPNGKPQNCDCVNGNCLLIPHATGILIGNVDERYEHGFGDFDYGYKVNAGGGQCYVASNFVGKCDRNDICGTWRDITLPICKRIELKNRPTGQPPYSHRVFLRKWFSTLWLWYLVSPYVSIIMTGLKYKITRRGMK